jgi:PST family polysaccharide transporter
LGTLISGFITFYYLLNKFKLHFSFQKIQNLEYYFQQSVPIFMSNFFIKLYVNSNKVILGAFVGMNEVAFYDLAEKITLISKIPQGIITQTIFPKISHEKDISVVKKIFKFSFLINCLLFVFLIVFGEKIVFYLGGEKMYPSVIILYIVSITIPIIALSNILGVQILVPFGFQRKFSFGVISGAFVYFIFVAISWILNYINIYSLAVITVLTEIYVTIYMFVTCKKLHLL